ncbi:MAG: hypothetical protein LBM67_04660 [Lentimicrobiaceae bacterium]|jgi:hypothetical protein|nr:hypothetical protein [Lentimicrobiaceae bacterium]
MDTTIQKPLYEDLLTYTHTEITKKTNVTTIAIALVSLLLGIGTLAASYYLGKTMGAVGSLLIVIGIGLLLVSVYLFVWRSSELVYKPTNSPILKKEYYFDGKYTQLLKSILNEGSSEKINTLKTLSDANVKVLMMYSKDRQFFAAQIYKYEPFTYDPCDKICSFNGNKAHALATNFLALNAIDS